MGEISMPRVAAMALLSGFLATAAVAETAPWPEQGVLLPLQDRVRDPELAAMVEAALERELSGRTLQADRGALREVMRRLRLRDPDASSPQLLDRLCAELGAGWLLFATLHHGASGPIPRVTLSGRVYRAGEVELSWAGFQSASGLDDVGLLGLGRVDDFELLVERAVKELVADFRAAGEGRRPARNRRPRDQGFLRYEIPPDAIGSLAVVPFAGLSIVDPTADAETVTALALALLHRRGVRVLQPAAVHVVLRNRGILWRGEADHRTLEMLRSEAGAGLVLTGAVESFELEGSSEEPEPRVAISARLLEPADGSILWIDGYERRGWDRQRLFRTGRIHDLGVLAERMMGSMLATPLRGPEAR